MKHLHLLGLCLAAIACARAAMADEVDSAQAERIPVLGWWGIPDKETTIERYRELAEAGFTINHWAGFADVNAAQAALDVAEKTGVKVLLSCPELQQDPEAVAKRFAKHPALFGYCLKDEPSAKEFAELGKLAARLQSVDRKAWTYVNLWPTYATPEQMACASYQEYIDRYLAEIPVQMISFDHYPGYIKTYDTSWYDNLGIAAKTGKPFWGFVLCCGEGAYDPVLGQMRLEAFTNLAYGAHGIQYFTYWTANDPRCKLNEGLITSAGARGPKYEVVKSLNADIAGMSPIFFGSKVVDIGHTAALSLPGAQSYKPRAPVVEIKTDQRGALVAVHANKKREYLVVVNRDPAAAMALTITFDGKRKIFSVDKRAVRSPVTGKSESKAVAPGDIAIYSWDSP